MSTFTYETLNASHLPYYEVCNLHEICETLKLYYGIFVSQTESDSITLPNVLETTPIAYLNRLKELLAFFKEDLSFLKEVFRKKGLLFYPPFLTNNINPFFYLFFDLRPEHFLTILRLKEEPNYIERLSKKVAEYELHYQFQNLCITIEELKKGIRFFEEGIKIGFLPSDH